MLLVLAGCSDEDTTSGATTTATTTTTTTSGPDPEEFASVTPSCVYSCPPTDCPEYDQGYVCQNLGAWTDIPHAESCGEWDGVFPEPKQGQCTATAPTGEVVKYAGVDPDDPTVLILAGGRRLTPAGFDHVFSDENTMTANLVNVPGTTLVLTVDNGNGDHIVRCVDAALIGAPGQSPVLSQVDFPPPESLDQGIAFSPPDRVFVASAQEIGRAHV